ncbi:MAG: hypothetical protein M3O61_00595 [Gemmatimonadota bacterium]|nr:hypothetical protein [Gemmatimonadota bacterium]
MRFVFNAVFVSFVLAAGTATAQHTHTTSDGAAGGSTVMNDADARAMAAHMEMTPLRPATAEDSIRAAAIVAGLRVAIDKYRNVKSAEADGFKMFAPQIKNQRVYHFTKGLWAIENQFRFNPAKPTSLLYRRDPRGNFVLIGAMYTAPKRYSVAELDQRVPTSITQWHKHVNWCVPKLGSRSRWTEVNNGRPVFGPLGVSTREECDLAGGRFHEEVLGWMVHANVFESDVWGDHHMRGDELGTDEN